MQPAQHARSKKSLTTKICKNFDASIQDNNYFRRNESTGTFKKKKNLKSAFLSSKSLVDF